MTLSKSHALTRGDTVARKVMLVDDLDGSPATETVTISYKNVEYTLDLSEDNALMLDESLQPFLSKATRNTKKRARTNSSDKAKNDGIREWARANGHDIPMRGRIPESIRSAYENRLDTSAASDKAPTHTY